MNEIVREISVECSHYVRISYFLDEWFSSWLYDSKVLGSTGMNQETALDSCCLELSKSAANKVLGESFMYADSYLPALPLPGSLSLAPSWAAVQWQ